MVLDKEYYKKLNESEQRFYGIINEIRVQMGMPTVEVPFYGPKESDAIVEPNEDEIHPRSKNELQQQPFEETRDRPTPINLEMDSHGANSAGPHVLNAPIETERISGAALADGDIVIILSSPDWIPGQSYLDANSNRGSYVEDFSGKSSEIDPTPLNLEPRIEIAGNGRDRADFFPFEISELQQAVVKEEFAEVDSCGNRIQEDIPLVTNLYRYPKHLKVTLDPLEVDMLKLVDNWKDSIDVRLGDFQLNSVIFLVKFSAPKVFVKMSKKEWNDVAESVKLLSTLGHFFYSVDSSRSFVFDPGKSNKFLLHNGSVEALVTLVFDPGGDQVAEVCAGKIPFWPSLCWKWRNAGHELAELLLIFVECGQLANFCC